MAARLTAAPDMWLSAIGSALTMVLAAIAAFQLSLPDRSPRWAWLPLPAVLLWLGASGAGCLRVWLVPGTHAAVLDDSKDCIAFILALSVPLSVLLLAMLRRGHTLQPGLTAVLAGFAAAAAAATLLVFFHPYDASATDLVVHVVAVGLVIVANRAFGGRLLRAAERLKSAPGAVTMPIRCRQACRSTRSRRTCCCAGNPWGRAARRRRGCRANRRAP